MIIKSIMMSNNDNANEYKIMMIILKIKQSSFSSFSPPRRRSPGGGRGGSVGRHDSVGCKVACEPKRCGPSCCRDPAGTLGQPPGSREELDQPI